MDETAKDKRFGAQATITKSDVGQDSLTLYNHYNKVASGYE